MRYAPHKLPSYILAIYNQPLISLYTAFEMWWHTRRNQISSLGEADESI